MQNEIDKQFTDAELKAMDDALTVLETTLADLPVLSGADKSAHVKAPDGARGWMQQMATRSHQNLNKLSRDYDPALVQRDLDLTVIIEPRQLRAQRIVDRLESAVFLANSDAFGALLGVRRQLKDSGVAGVDDNLSDGLQRFFNRTNRAATTTITAATPAK